MTALKQLEKDIAEIKNRNKKVEQDKAWETSWTRKLMVALLTYVVLVYFFYALGFPYYFINALVPMLAFLISTLTLTFAKNLWIGFYKK